MIDVRRLNLEKHRRLIVISDIHASLKLLKRLLKKVKYTADDYLFINGDLCEKGNSSLEVIDFVRKLTLKSDGVFVSKGNCDVVHRFVYQGNEGIYRYMENRKQSILNEMLELHGKTVADFRDLKELGEFYSRHFHDEIQWLESLPVAFETDDHLFIHAGLNKSVEQTDEVTALSVPAFYEKGHYEQKMVIVGHWPVVNYRTNEICSQNPIIDYDKRIIAMDGGNRIKSDGQLNALVMEDGHYSYTYVDALTSHTYIKRGHHPAESISGAVTFPHYEMTILEEKQYFTRCRNDELNIEQWIKNEYLTDRDGKKAISNDVSTTFLSVHANEKVNILNESCKGYTLIKKMNGEIGWVPDYCV